MTLKLVMCVAIAAGTVQVAGAQPTFAGLGFLPGGDRSMATAVSGDGAVVVGWSRSSLGVRAYRWSEETGMVSLGVLTGGSSSLAEEVSDDGLVVVGYAAVADADHPFRWTATEGMQSIGLLSLANPHTYAFATSGDGSVIVGGGIGVPWSRAFRWTFGGGFEDLGTLPGGSQAYATGVSADGALAAGFCLVANRQLPVRWSAAEGMVGLEVAATGPYAATAEHVSANGRCIVGSDTNATAYRWSRDEGVISLGRLAGAPFSLANGANHDGMIIVGRSNNGNLNGGGAFLWTPNLGIIELAAYLSARGVNLSGWQLFEATDISADGRTVVGRGQHNGLIEAWIVTLHGECGTSDFDLDGDFGTDADIQAFFGCLAGNCCTNCFGSDFNRDGTPATDADIESFFRVLAGANC